MKFFYFAFLILFSSSLFSQSISYTNKKGQRHLLGTIERYELQAPPFQEWYDTQYEKYEMDKEVIEKINAHYDEEIKIDIYLGTWCGDSKREVTRFLKIMDESNIDPKSIKLIGLDSRPGKTKQGPNGEEKGVDIHRVPTFVFSKNDEEIARIVESPVSSMEKDVAQIYAGLAPTPNYKAANLVLKYFKKMDTAEADSFFTKHIRYIKSISKNDGELNTLGYVLLSAKEYEKAIVVFKLNNNMHPESANTFDSLAEAYMKKGDKKLAVENYMKSYHLDPENDNAVNMILEMMGEGERLTADD